MRVVEIFNKLREVIVDKAIDALLVTNPENIRYLTGFIAHEVGDGVLLVTGKGITFFTDGRYLDVTRDWPDVIEVVDWSASANRFDAIKARLSANTRVGFETGVSYGFAQRLNDALQDHATTVGVDGVVEDFRIIKTPEEILLLQRAGKYMDKAIADVLGIDPVGRTEREIMVALNHALRQEAASDDLSFPTIVASGPNSAVPHHTTGSRRVRKDDALLIDYGVRVEGYCGDATVTVLLEGCGTKMREVFAVVRQAQEAAMRSARPGMTCGELDAIARGIIKEAGYGEFFVHSLGHGVGLETHEAPAVGIQKPTAGVVLQEGMCITIEPGIYISDLGGVRLERFCAMTGVGLVPFNNHPFTWSIA